MTKKTTSIVLFGVFSLVITLSSCTSTQQNSISKTNNYSDIQKSKSIPLPKIIALLSSKKELISPIMELDTTEGFIVWDCKSYINGEDVLFQIGYFTLSNHKDQVIGFIIREKPFLQDILWTEGTPMPSELVSPDSLTSEQILSPSGIAPSAESTLFSKAGLDYKWDWGNYEIGEHYTIIMEPDGTVRYYNFTNVPDGESISPSGVYKAYKQL
jgi:hypothetical protein